MTGPLTLAIADLHGHLDLLDLALFEDARPGMPVDFIAIEA